MTSTLQSTLFILGSICWMCGTIIAATTESSTTTSSSTSTSSSTTTTWVSSSTTTTTSLELDDLAICINMSNMMEVLDSGGSQVSCDVSGEPCNINGTVATSIFCLEISRWETIREFGLGAIGTTGSTAFCVDIHLPHDPVLDVDQDTISCDMTDRYACPEGSICYGTPPLNPASTSSTSSSTTTPYLTSSSTGVTMPSTTTRKSTRLSSASTTTTSTTDVNGSSGTLPSDLSVSTSTSTPYTSTTSTTYLPGRGNDDKHVDLEKSTQKEGGLSTMEAVVIGSAILFALTLGIAIYLTVYYKRRAQIHLIDATTQDYSRRHDDESSQGWFVDEYGNRSNSSAHNFFEQCMENVQKAQGLKMQDCHPAGGAYGMTSKDSVS